MEYRKYGRGLRRYESLLHVVCCTDEYYHLSEKEWEGCLGVACAISVIEGVPPTLFTLSKHLDIPHYNINLKHAFERLKDNGIFTNRYDIKNDPSLTGNAVDKKWQTGAEIERNAWCGVAGISGGFVGIKKEEEIT